MWSPYFPTNSGSLLADLLDDVVASVAYDHAAVDADVTFRHDRGGRTSEHHLGYLVCLTEGLLPALEHGAFGWSFRNWLRLHMTRPGPGEFYPARLGNGGS